MEGSTQRTRGWGDDAIFPHYLRQGSALPRGDHRTVRWNKEDFLGSLGKGLQALGWIRNRARRVIAANSVEKRKKNRKNCLSGTEIQTGNKRAPSSGHTSMAFSRQPIVLGVYHQNYQDPWVIRCIPSPTSHQGRGSCLVDLVSSGRPKCWVILTVQPHY